MQGVQDPRMSTVHRSYINIANSQARSCGHSSYKRAPQSILITTTMNK